MPHVIVKLWPGRNDEIKSNLAKRIAHIVAGELKVDMQQSCYLYKLSAGE